MLSLLTSVYVCALRVIASTDPYSGRERGSDPIYHATRSKCKNGFVNQDNINLMTKSFYFVIFTNM